MSLINLTQTTFFPKPPLRASVFHTMTPYLCVGSHEPLKFHHNTKRHLQKNVGSKSLIHCSNNNESVGDKDDKQKLDAIMRFYNDIKDKNLEEMSELTCSNNNESDGDKDDKQKLDTVMRFYNAIKDKNLEEMSELLGDDCQCLCNLPFVGLFRGKKKVLQCLSMMMRFMGEHVRFVIKPKTEDGIDIGIQWQIDWQKTGTPLGRGFSLYTVHIYKGEFLIRNVEVIMEPLLHLEPLKLKLMEFLKPMMEKLKSCTVMDKKERNLIIYSLLTTLVMVVSFIVLKNLQI